MLSNATFRKIRSISDGNFHGCYASNKAEKFKFRRLSQGIESCAQAQALKLRKEEKELVKVLKVLEKEKCKHEKERQDKQYYSQLLLRTKEHKDDVQLRNGFSCNAVSFINKCGINELDGNKKSASLLKKSSGSLSRHHTSSKQLKKSYKAQDFDEVVPFYMNHSYTHYHFDPHYDDLLKNNELGVSSEMKCESDEPSWKKSTKLSRLKQRKHSNVSTTCKTNESSKHIQAKSSNNFEGKNESSAIVSSHSQALCLLKEKKSSKTTTTLPDIKPSLNEQNSSVLTPIERQELAKYHRNGRSNSLTYDAERKSKKLIEHRQQRRNTYHSSNAVVHVKNMIKNRIGNGDELQDILDDDLIEDLITHCDDGRVYPAYREDLELTFEDFRALRKCKYLRLSEMNWKSLKQATLQVLSLI